MTDFYKKYFDDFIDYPEGVAFDPMPLGVLWSYISSTFLNAFINYVEIKSAFVMGRYTKWDEILDREINIREPAHDGEWIKFKGTKEECFLKLNEPGRVYHPKLDCEFGGSALV